ncbi:hypothetical protein GCM10019059_25490 [Camelimonas fluminis]|nr:hypothetical protein GCM10019059_25490 [Camelimonas fluminis]
MQPIVAFSRSRAPATPVDGGQRAGDARWRGNHQLTMCESDPAPVAGGKRPEQALVRSQKRGKSTI